MHLAIETAHRDGGVAIRGADGVVRAAALESASGIDDRLMPEIDRLFRELGSEPTELSVLGVSVGPGGFTGLRIAVSTARALAMATGCKLVAVPTAVVAAADCPHRVAVLLSSRRGTVWCTQVAPGGAIKGTPGLISADGVLVAIKGCQAVMADTSLPADMVERVGTVPIMPLKLKAAACLDATEALAAAGRFVEPADLSPLYPRVPEATRLFEAR